jgi:hypothetical protein
VERGGGGQATAAPAGITGFRALYFPVKHILQAEKGNNTMDNKMTIDAFQAYLASDSPPEAGTLHHALRNLAAIDDPADAVEQIEIDTPCWSNWSSL